MFFLRFEVSMCLPLLEGDEVCDAPGLHEKCISQYDLHKHSPRDLLRCCMENCICSRHDIVSSQFVCDVELPKS